MDKLEIYIRPIAARHQKAIKLNINGILNMRIVLRSRRIAQVYYAANDGNQIQQD